MAGHPDTPGGLVGAATLPDFVAGAEEAAQDPHPGQAGPPVDAVVEQLLGAGVETDDIVVDCGNSQWTDTIKREKQYESRCRFFGSGVSGGEVGRALRPSLMPGGDPGSWEHLDAPSGRPSPPRWIRRPAGRSRTTAPGKPVKGGEPCTAYIGPNGAGHYVKMVHNGIEYGDMQLISRGLSPPHRAGRPDARRAVATSSPTGTSGELELLPHRDHRRHPASSAIRSTGQPFSSTRSSTPRARRAPASGPA